MVKTTKEILLLNIVSKGGINILIIKLIAAPRCENKRSWLYRIRPSVVHLPFVHTKINCVTDDWKDKVPNPNQVSIIQILKYHVCLNIRKYTIG